MGLIIAKFRKKKTNLEVLEQLDKDIKSIEDYRYNTEQRQKKIVGRFLVFSIGLYILLAIIVYFYYYPNNIKDRILYMVPLIGMPSLILVLKRFVTWWYNRKISKNQSKLSVLREEKKKMLETVMETETYKVARAILEKYAPPEQPRKIAIIPQQAGSELITTIATPSSPIRRAPIDMLRNRFPQAGGNNKPMLGNLSPPQPPGSPAAVTPKHSAKGYQTPTAATVVQNHQAVPPSSSKQQLPRAILPKDRSIIDKMVDFLVGDGPSNRYALICVHCAGHNGMALREEFEYLSYNCCYCMRFNPARKKRPAPPKLDMHHMPQQRIAFSDTSESEKNSSGSDTEKELAAPVDAAVGSSSKVLEVKTLYTNEPAVSDFDKLSTTDDFDVKLSDSDVMEDGEELIRKLCTDATSASCTSSNDVDADSDTLTTDNTTSNLANNSDKTIKTEIIS